MPSSLRQVLQAHLCSLAKAGEEPGPVQALERLHLHLSLESTAETWVGVGVTELPGRGDTAFHFVVMKPKGSIDTEDGSHSWQSWKFIQVPSLHTL